MTGKEKNTLTELGQSDESRLMETGFDETCEEEVFFSDELCDLFRGHGYEIQGRMEWTRLYFDESAKIRTRVSFFWSNACQDLQIMGSIMDLAYPDFPSMKIQWDIETPDSEEIDRVLSKVANYYSGP